MYTSTFFGENMVNQDIRGNRHMPVLKETVVDYLVTDRAGLYVDCTVGGGGHAEAILQRLNPEGTLIGFDVDEEAVEAVSRRLKPFGDRVQIIRADFSTLEETLPEAGVSMADGFLFDLGLSSLQLDAASRGFSYRIDGPLDMRMDPSLSKTARDIVNWYTRNELIRVFRDYGEERYAARISRAIIRAREGQPIETTSQLTAIILSVIPSRSPQKTLSRIFQAIRIEVNDELCKLKRGLQAAIGFLKPGGRMAVIAYHSLEDRIVKSIFAQRSKGCHCPPGLPACGCGQRQELRIITRRVVRPPEEEIEANPRAHSAKLRVAERIKSELQTLGTEDL